MRQNCAHFYSASLIKNKHDKQLLFILTEFGNKHIDDRGLPVKRPILGMLNRSKTMGSLSTD